MNGRGGQDRLGWCVCVCESRKAITKPNAGRLHENRVHGKFSHAKFAGKKSGRKNNEKTSQDVVRKKKEKKKEKIQQKAEKFATLQVFRWGRKHTKDEKLQLEGGNQENIRGDFEAAPFDEQRGS